MITKDGINSSCLDTNAIVHYGIRLAIINIIISVTLATALAESTPAPWWTSIACPPYEIEGVALRCHINGASAGSRLGQCRYLVLMGGMACSCSYAISNRR